MTRKDQLIADLRAELKETRSRVDQWRGHYFEVADALHALKNEDTQYIADATRKNARLEMLKRDIASLHAKAQNWA